MSLLNLQQNWIGTVLTMALPTVIKEISILSRLDNKIINEVYRLDYKFFYGNTHILSGTFVPLI